jgi:hypothetical protein
MRTRKLLLAAVAVATLAVIAACGKKKSEEGDPRCDEELVPYEGGATDEACKTMLDAEDAGAVVTGTAGVGNIPRITLPTNGAAIAVSASALTIHWTSPIDIDGETFLFHTWKPKPEPLFDRILEEMNPISTAWAHLPPLTGTLHMVRITGIAGRTDPFLLFTTKLHTVIAGTNLAPILATTSPMTIELTDAYLTENRILTPSSDGPFRPVTPTTIHVQ